MRAVAGLLTVGKLLAVGGRAVTLGASGDAAVGLVGLTGAGAGDVVASSHAAAVLDVAFKSVRKVRFWWK